MARQIQSSPTIKALLSFVLQNTIESGTFTTSVTQELSYTPGTAFTSGTTANKADMVWCDNARTITSGNTEDIDVYDLAAFDIGGGAGKDAVGLSWVAVEITTILVTSSTASVGDLHVGGKAATTAWNSPFNSDDDALVVVKPGGMFMLHAPTDAAYAVADTTNHLLTMGASGGNVTYSVMLVGRSA
jgi:hypothetical protein